MERTPTKLKPVDDPSRLFKLDYKVKYLECDLADKRIESKPVLQIFLSSHFVRNPETGGVVNIHLDEDDLDKVYTGSLIGTLHRKYNDVSLTAAIGLDSYAIHRNDSGYACYVNVGTSHAFVGSILQDVKTKGTYDHAHELVMRTVLVAGLEPVKKGVIEFCVTKVEMGPGIRLAQTASCLQAPMSSIEQSIGSYINATMQLESSLPDLLPNTERIRAPYDLSQVGIELTGQMFLPSSAFAIQEPIPTNQEFWYNAFERVMARRNMTVHDYNDFDEKEKARTMAKMICYVAQSFDYIGDAVELSNRRIKNSVRQRVGTDEWTVSANAGAGDCEDDDRTNGVFHKSLKTVAFDASSDSKYLPLLEMQAIARRYVYISTLAVVHGAKIGDQEGWGAHMVGSMIEDVVFMEALAKTDMGKSVLERMEPATVPVGTNPAAQRPDSLVGEVANARAPRGRLPVEGSANPAAERPGSPGSLPFLFCEGTGIIDPIGYDDPILDQRKYIAINMKSAAGFKKEIPHAEYAASPFYHANLFGISDCLFEQGVNVGGFIFATADANSLKRGVLFTDMLRLKDNLTIIPQPVIPEPIMDVMHEAVALFPPPKPYMIDKSKPFAGKEQHPLWDKFVKAVKSFHRTGPNIKFHPSVDCFVRPHQFNETVINMMISDASQMDRLYDAAYEVEHMTNSMYTYRVRLWVR